MACGREVGIDVEHLREDVEVLELAAHFFCRGARRAASRPTTPGLFQLLDAQGGLHQGPRRRTLAPARGLRRDARAGRAGLAVARRRRRRRRHALDSARVERARGLRRGRRGGGRWLATPLLAMVGVSRA